MICDRVRILNFRNIEEADVRFSEGVNVLWGDNAQGKTNLLEAIRFAGCGKSFRAQKETELIRFGCESASVSLDYRDKKRVQNLTARIFTDARHRQVEHNGVRMTRLSDMVGAFETVLFCPEHLSLIKDGPAARRNFLDAALCSMRPVYLNSLQRYNRILKERNRLLREASESPDGRRVFDETATAWSLSLAKEAALIAGQRQEYVKMLRFCVAECFWDMTDAREKPEVAYIGSSGDEAEFYEDARATEKRYAELLTTRCDREIAAGTTLWGIHKDDVDVTLNGKSARLYASQGQQRSLSLAFKLAEGIILAEATGEIPVYLLDDVLSELDASRRSYLLGEIKDKQVILTSCEPSQVKDAAAIRVEGGEYFSAKRGN